MQSYRKALARLPPRKGLPHLENRKGKSKVEQDIDSGPDQQATDGNDAGDEAPHPDLEPPPLSETEQNCAKARSILNGNIGACHVKLVSSTGSSPQITYRLVFFFSFT